MGVAAKAPRWIVALSLAGCTATTLLACATSPMAGPSASSYPSSAAATDRFSGTWDCTDQSDYSAEGGQFTVTIRGSTLTASVATDGPLSHWLSTTSGILSMEPENVLTFSPSQANQHGYSSFGTKVRIHLPQKIRDGQTYSVPVNEPVNRENTSVRITLKGDTLMARIPGLQGAGMFDREGRDWISVECERRARRPSN